MIVDPAWAQTPPAGQPGAIGTGFEFFVPLVLMFVIFYFLIIRPQRKRMKQHEEMLKALRRGDTVVTAGGLIGKVAKIVDDGEIEVEIANGVRVRTVRSMVSEVRAKSEPAKDAG